MIFFSKGSSVWFYRVIIKRSEKSGDFILVMNSMLDDDKENSN